MSCNVEGIIVLYENNLRIDAADLKLLQERGKREEKLPEVNLLDELEGSKATGDDLTIPIGTDLEWYGEGSGYSWDWFEEHVLGALQGEVIFLVLWEGGTNPELYRVTDDDICSQDLEEALASLGLDRLRSICEPQD